MALNLHSLRLFVAVADQGGFSRAATMLHLSQPAISKAILGLEREVGLPLFEREARAVRLTQAGSTLYDRARELFGVERDAEEELRALRGLERGMLRVGASTTIATYFLPTMLAEFHRRHPGVTLRVVSANTRAIARLLLQRRLDVALVEGPINHARITVSSWREDELVVIAPHGHMLAKSRPIPVASLVSHPFIVRERGSGTREVAASMLAAHGIHPPIALTLGSTEAVKQAVAAGLGLAIVSRAAAADQLALGRIVEVRVAKLALRRSLTRLQLNTRTQSIAATAFDHLLSINPVGQN